MGTGQAREQPFSNDLMRWDQRFESSLLQRGVSCEPEFSGRHPTTSHASRVARDLGDVSFSTVWRVAQRAGIELTAGREAKGYKRLAPEQRAKVIEVRNAKPEATQ